MTQTAIWFDVVGIAPHGEVHSARIQATSAEEAVRHAQLGGLRVLACEPSRGAAWRVLPRAPGARARLDVAQFAQELAALLDAGLGMIDALRTVAGKQRGDDVRRVLERVQRAIAEGLPLSQALAKEGDVFPQLVVAAVAASEETGDLAASLRRFADHQMTLRALRGRFVGAALYPAILLAVGALVVLFLLGVVVPRFALLIEHTQNELPLASRLLLSWGSTFAAHPLGFLLAAGALVAGVALLVLRAHRRGWRVAGLQRAWLIGPLIRLFRQAQFFRTTAMLVGGGIPALRALSMSSALLTPEDQAALDGACRSIGEGVSIGEAMAASGVADVVAQRMLEVAGRTGRLGETLDRIAAFQEAQLARALDVTARLVEPVLMVFIGLVIGGIVVLMYLPIFELAAGLQ